MTSKIWECIRFMIGNKMVLVDRFLALLRTRQFSTIRRSAVVCLEGSLSSLSMPVTKMSHMGGLLRLRFDLPLAKIVIRHLFTFVSGF